MNKAATIDELYAFFHANSSQYVAHQHNHINYYLSGSGTSSEAEEDDQCKFVQQALPPVISEPSLAILILSRQWNFISDIRTTLYIGFALQHTSGTQASTELLLNKIIIRGCTDLGHGSITCDNLVKLYDCVIFDTYGGGFGVQQSQHFGNILADYCDRCGAVIMASCTNHDAEGFEGIGGRFVSDGYHPLKPASTYFSQSFSTRNQLEIVSDNQQQLQQCHSILKNVNKIDSGIWQGHAQCDKGINEGATVLAVWKNDQEPLVTILHTSNIKKKHTQLVNDEQEHAVGGTVVSLNIGIVSCKVENMYWDYKKCDMIQLLYNSVTFASRRKFTCTYD